MISLTGKTILQIIPTLETGGAERTTLEMAAAILEAGGQALVVSAGGPLVPSLERMGAEHISLPVQSKNPAQMLWNACALKMLCHKRGVSLLHVRSRAPAWSALYAARRAKLPLVSTYHGIYSAHSRLKRFYNSAMARGTYVIANSAYTRARVLAEHAPGVIRDPARVVTIHRGADLEIFDREKVTKDRLERLRTAWGHGAQISILLPGRLTSWKGQAVLIEALAAMKNRYPHGAMRAILCGSAQGREGYESYLTRKISELKMQDVIKIVGHEPDMPAAYLWADIALSASTRPEAFGRVAIEAQAMGCPVIATRHGGAMETVLAEETGFLVPPDDSRALAEALGRFIALPAAQRQQMGAAAAARVEAQFSTRTMTSKTLEIYQKVLDEDI